MTFPLNYDKSPATGGRDWKEYSGTVNTPMIGVPIPAGAVVFDLDTYKGVNTSDVDTALGCSLDWDVALLQRTPKGGEHYAFSVPVASSIINGVNVLGVKGFDIRSSGKGYIATGEGYVDESLFGVINTLHEVDMLPALSGDVLTMLSAQVDMSDGDNDLMFAIASQPLDISVDDMRVYLSKLRCDHAADHDTWLKVMMAIYHQTSGSDDGYAIFDDFSKLSLDNYNKVKNKKRWGSLSKSTRTNPVTFASVIELVGGHDVIVEEEIRSLEELAKDVSDKDSYVNFKKKVKTINKHKLPDDLRAMLAATVAGNVGKNLGLTKTEIKRALMPTQKERPVNDEIDRPDWVADWVYVEKLCEFANTELNYSIKREAFNAKFDRQIDCLMAEKQAANMALVDYSMPTVVDKMFWPGAHLTFEYDGMPMLNTYKISSVIAPDEIDEDGQKVIDMLMQHIRFTLSDEREQGILLDWLAYVVQNPGKRINWALLLQGTQGSGKSYFVNLLQAILGTHVRNLDPTAIAGRFTGWAHGALVVAVEEIRISGTNKYEVLDRMKPFISNQTIQIEEKGRDHRTVPNFTNYLLLTNHKDAIPMGDGDRRYCVLFSRMQSEQQLFEELGGEQGAADYFELLFDETNRRADALMYHLMHHKISAEFNPVGRAPMTEARTKMINIAISPERLALEDAINEHRCAIINENIIDITHLNNLCVFEGDEIPQHRKLSAILLDMGYEQIEGRKVKIKGARKNHYIWVAPRPAGDVAKLVRDYHDVGF